jgi:hypothetical protein
MPFNINIKSADEKRIDEICLSLQGNSLQLDLLTELYDLFIKEENLEENPEQNKIIEKN